MQDLRATATVDYSFTPAKSDKQFKRALELRARCAAKLVRVDGDRLVIQVRDLATREETQVADVRELLASPCLRP